MISGIAAALLFAVGILSGLAAARYLFPGKKNVPPNTAPAKDDFVTLQFTEKNLALDAEITYHGSYHADENWITEPRKYFAKKPDTFYHVREDYYGLNAVQGTAGFELRWETDVTFNAVRLNENTDAAALFRLYALKDGQWDMIYEQDRISTENICYTGNVTAAALRFELIDTLGTVELESIGVFRLNKYKRDNFKVSQYLRMDRLDIVDRLDDPGFAGYYDAVTDVIIFDAIFLDPQGSPFFYNNAQDAQGRFEANLNALKTIIGSRPVRIWATVFFDQYKQPPEGSPYRDLDLTADMLLAKRDAVNAGLQALVEKYGLYGIDYDWEFPETDRHWEAYNQILCDTAAFTKVSVAISPWRFNAPASTIEKIEHFNVMFYDHFDNRGYHSTMMSGAYEALTYMYRKLTLIPKEKILLGIPTYGRTVNRSGSAWPEYRNYVVKTGGGNEDGNAGVYQSVLGKWTNVIPAFTYTENGMEKKARAYLNGYGIVRDKTLFALAAELGGVMIFRAKCDAPWDYQYSLHRAIKDALDDLLETN